MSDEIEDQELGVSDDERSKRQNVIAKRSGQEMKDKWAEDDREKIEKHEKAIAPPIVTEPRCRVCTSLYRPFIEEKVVRGHSYKSIAEQIPPDESGHTIDRRSISNHYEKHMDIERKRIRAELEQQAKQLAQNTEEAVEGAITERGMLKVLAHKAYEDAMKGITTVEPKDLVQMLKLLNDMEVNSSTAKAEENEIQLRIFVRAIQNVLDQENIVAIVDEVRRLRQLDDISFAMEGTLTEPPKEIEAEVVDDEQL